MLRLRSAGQTLQVETESDLLEHVVAVGEGDSVGTERQPPAGVEDVAYPAHTRTQAKVRAGVAGCNSPAVGQDLDVPVGRPHEVGEGDVRSEEPDVMQALHGGHAEPLDVVLHLGTGFEAVGHDSGAVLSSDRPAAPVQVVGHGGGPVRRKQYP